MEDTIVVGVTLFEDLSESEEELFMLLKLEV